LVRRLILDQKIVGSSPARRTRIQEWTSGKSTVFEAVIRRFESCLLNNGEVAEWFKAASC